MEHKIIHKLKKAIKPLEIIIYELKSSMLSRDFSDDISVEIH